MLGHHRRDLSAAARSGSKASMAARDSVSCNCLRDDIPVGALDAVASPFEPEQPRARDLVGERLAVREWKHGIGGAVDD